MEIVTINKLDHWIVTTKDKKVQGLTTIALECKFWLALTEIVTINIIDHWIVTKKGFGGSRIDNNHNGKQVLTSLNRNSPINIPLLKILILTTIEETMPDAECATEREQMMDIIWLAFMEIFILPVLKVITIRIP